MADQAKEEKGGVCCIESRLAPDIAEYESNQRNEFQASKCKFLFFIELQNLRVKSDLGDTHPSTPLFLGPVWLIAKHYHTYLPNFTKKYGEQFAHHTFDKVWQIFESMIYGG